MVFDAFKKMVDSLVGKSNQDMPDGESLTVEFEIDGENEKYFARVSDGTVISGNFNSSKLSVRFR